MKKVFFLVVFLFLITGCEATYDLEISDDKALETTIALERYSSDLYSEGKKTQDTFLKRHYLFHGDMVCFQKILKLLNL